MRRVWKDEHDTGPANHPATTRKRDETIASHESPPWNRRNRTRPDFITFRPEICPRRYPARALQYCPVGSDSKKNRRNTIRAVIAWAGTILILAYLYFTTDMRQVMNAFRNANLVLFTVTAFLSVAVTYVTDVATVRFLLGKVGIKVGFGEFARIKGASYLLNIVNYNLALVMMAAVVKKRSSKGWGSAGSPFILLNFIDLSVFSLIVQVAIWTGRSPFEKLPTTILALLTLAGLVAGPTLCLISRWRTAPGKLGKLINQDIMAAFRYVTPFSLATITTMRLGLILEYGAMNLLFMKSFGINIPPIDQLFIMSITSFIAMIPISISGIGSTQYVMRDLCKPYVPDAVASTGQGKIAVVDAMTTAGIFGVLLIRVVIGIVCMRGVAKYISDDGEDK